jgi:surface protein
MPNAIKYNVSAETLALKKGNFWIGTGDVGKGPTNVTGYYNGITPPTGGFTIYLNKESGGPSIYTVTTEAQLVSLTNTIGAQSFTTSSQCLNWFATQTDKMVFNIDYPAIVTNGLVLNVDAGFTPSYPTTGTTWYDVSSSVNNGTLVNGPTFSSAGGGSIVFDGADDYGVTSPTNFTANNDFTYEIWVNSNQYIESRGILSNKGYWQAGGQGAAIGNISNPQYIYGYVTTNTGHFDISSNVGPTYGWTNVIMRRSNNDLRFFINGAQQGSTQTISGTVTDVSDKFWLGSYNNGNTPWLGNMAIARVYNRALTAAEVLQNYNAMKDRFAFIFTVKTDNAGVSTSTQFRMPLISSTGLYFTVNWGDGTPVETITNHTLAIHTYATAGTYTISTVGNLKNWSFNEGGDLLKMLNVFQWAGLEINEFRAFRGCTNLTATATDAPLITTTTLDRFFQNCPNFNGAIGNWNVSGITDMQHMFEGATAFNQDIGGWNVSNVTNFGSFMAGKTAANYSAANLDSIYNGWSSRAVKPNINITFGSIKYNSTAQSGKNILTGSPNNWTITDGGQL